MHQSLTTVMFGFGSLKVLEYSIMSAAMEMIYMPMDHQVRYLGKELIRFFGHRLGKALTSFLLSIATAKLEPSLKMQAVWCATLSAVYGSVMYLLCAHFVETRRALVKAVSDDSLLDKASSSNTSPIQMVPNVVFVANDIDSPLGISTEAFDTSTSKASDEEEEEEEKAYASETDELGEGSSLLAEGSLDDAKSSLRFRGNFAAPS